jgi:hypothetical protein
LKPPNPAISIPEANDQPKRGFHGGGAGDRHLPDLAAREPAGLPQCQVRNAHFIHEGGDFFFASFGGAFIDVKISGDVTQDALAGEVEGNLGREE